MGGYSELNPRTTYRSKDFYITQTLRRGRWVVALRRVLSAIPTVWVVIGLLSVATPRPAALSTVTARCPRPCVGNLQAKYHLDLPLWQQYLLYFKGPLQGDLGASFRYADWSVNDLEASALPVSLSIGGIAMLLSGVDGVALGIGAAHGRTAPSTPWS